MSIPRRPVITFLAVLGVLTLPAPGPPADDSNWERLRSMPLEQRNHLSDQLKTFDGLDRVEKAAVRALDRKIADEQEDNRAVYYAVLRRYHLWVRSLTDEQQRKLSEAPPEQRMALVSKIRAEQRASSPPEPSIYNYADFGGASPFELATRIKAWLSLTDAEKDEISKLSDTAKRTERLNELARKVKSIRRPSKEELDAIYDNALKSGRFPFLKKVEEAKKKEKVEEAKKKNIRHRFQDNYYFVEHPPQKVHPEKLLQFERALPAWFRPGFDSLPPEEARRRLTILYRLVFGSGEMPAAKPKPAAPASAPAPGPAPAPKPAPGSSPF
jgi:hypothetical protein